MDEAPFEEQAEEPGEGNGHAPHLHLAHGYLEEHRHGKEEKDESGGEDREMDRDLSAQVDGGEDEDKGNEQITHDAEYLDEEVGRVGARPPAEIPYPAG